MPGSIGGAIETVVGSTEKQVPVTPGSIAADATETAACGSASTAGQSVNGWCTFGSTPAGTVPAARATRTHPFAEHWYTPSARPTSDNPVRPPSAPPGTSTRHVPSAASVTVTVRGAPPPVHA